MLYSFIAKECEMCVLIYLFNWKTCIGESAQRPRAQNTLSLSIRSFWPHVLVVIGAVRLLPRLLEILLSLAMCLLCINNCEAHSNKARLETACLVHTRRTRFLAVYILYWTIKIGTHNEDINAENQSIHNYVTSVCGHKWPNHALTATCTMPYVLNEFDWSRAHAAQFYAAAAIKRFSVISSIAWGNDWNVAFADIYDQSGRFKAERKCVHVRTSADTRTNMKCPLDQK